MCNPALAVMAIGTAFQAYGQIQQGKAAEAEADYRAEQAQADANAERGAVEVQADRIRKLARVKASSANAASAASGMVTGEGSALTIQQDIYGSAEEDAAMTIFNGNDARARLNAEGEAYKIQGQNAKSSANMTALGTLAQGAGDVYGGWKKMQ